MRPLIKILAIVVGAVVALVVIAILAVVLLVDPNDYKEPIAKAVAEKTGRTLTFEGDLGLTFFPWLGVSLGPVSLSNAPGFGEAPMLKLDHAAVSVKLLPLLSKKVELDTVSVSGLTVNLARNAEGKTNWDDLVAKTAAEGEKPAAEKPAEEKPGEAAALPVALRVGGVEIEKANVVWDDKQAGQRFAVTDVNVSLGEVAENKPVDFRVALKFDSTKPQVSLAPVVSGTFNGDFEARRYALSNLKLTVDASGEAVVAKTARLTLALASADADEKAHVYVLKGLALDVTASGGGLPMDTVSLSLAGESFNMDQASGRVDLPKLTVNLEAKGDKLPGKEVKGQLTAKVAADLKAGTASLAELALTLRDLSLTGALAATGLNAEPSFTGQLNLAAFNPKKLMNELGLAPLETADASALTNLAATLSLAGSASAAQVKDVKVLLDGTTITGRAGITDFAQPAYAFSFAVDDIDADRYLPPAKPEAAKAEAKPAPAPAEPAKKPDYTALRALKAKGDLSVGKLKIRNLKLANLKFALTAEGGVITVDPLAAELYQGRVDNSMVFDVRGAEPAFKEKTVLKGVQAGPLLADLTGKERLTGTTDLSLDVSGRGEGGEAIKRTLSGTAAFSFKNGAVKGVNIAKLIREAQDVLSGKKPVADENEATDFAELSGTFKMDNGLVTNNDLSLKSPLLRVTGEGSVNLPKDVIDYLVTASVVGSLKGQGGEELTALKNVPIPIRVSGTTAEPKFALDPKALAEALAKGALKKETEAVKGAVEEKAKGLLEGLGGKKSPGKTTPAPSPAKEKPKSPADFLKGLGK